MQGLPRLDPFFFLRIRFPKATQLTITITAITMPTIAPTERLCEEWESPEVVSEVRLGIVAKVENEGSNVM
jgi:hypothetical protein